VNSDLQNITQKTNIHTVIYKTLHRKQTYKQWSTKHYTENKHTNSDLQNITQKTNIQSEQWSTKHYTENKLTNSDLQNITQKTNLHTVIYKTLHRKQTYTQWSTKHYTENKHTNSDLQNITQKTKSMNSTNSTEIEDELGCFGKRYNGS
jgi:hypothetical protein